MDSSFDNSKLPNHIGIIMDGNGRWATKRGLPRKAGHFEGVKAAKRIISEAAKLNIPYVTYYVFSTENWRRPTEEVEYLMNLLATRIFSEMDLYRRLQSRILIAGDLDSIPKNAKDALEATMEATKSFNKINVTLAINYGGRDEIIRSFKRLANKKEINSITEDDIRENLGLPLVPPVDLIIRSGGEKRISNFLLWDAAYAELAFYDSLWPDWTAKQLKEALSEYCNRERKFGGII